MNQIGKLDRRFRVEAAGLDRAEIEYAAIDDQLGATDDASIPYLGVPLPKPNPVSLQDYDQGDRPPESTAGVVNRFRMIRRARS